ncbi:raucaffricine-O-beta-D-glucosidase-like [Sesamum indicum]|uniref:Raucaffricine-O-beta-D-glucosidase-like n=1 Tax=Sesamum indicum TaxID=4182 RepID=A0A8M8USW7_SESIN|nr:raucaffricine-O-beta-D-glucosidase-like [Sesamum indicum]
MGGGGEHHHGGDFRAKVWSMTGGPYCRPKHWKRNTAFAMAGIVLIYIPIAMKSAELEQRPHLPVHPFPPRSGRILDGSNGNVATDLYARFEEDITWMKKMGFDAYRFLISWSRILPDGRCCAGINKEGIDYYNTIINTVIKHGLEPYVTLFHFDLPQALQEEYGGFLSKNIVRDFREYVELCFWEFGDRVKHWITANEPTTYCVNGYASCTFPPSQAISSAYILALALQSKDSVSDPPPANVDLISTPPYVAQSSNINNRNLYGSGPNTYDPKNVYTAARNMLLAHSEAVHTYRTKFQGTLRREDRYNTLLHLV